MEKTKKLQTIKENYLFRRAYNRGKSFASRTVVLYVLKNKDKSCTKAGFTVSKNRGKAVVRNRTRRRIKESFRRLRPLLKEGYLLIFVARQSAVEAPSSEIAADMHFILKKAQLYEDGTERK